ncbi:MULTISPECIES: hypothetical protein [Nostocales]|jgi:hypothetical protein|uniref:DUF2281 domain-containing protein n=1 Tax=Dolichospermum heterosporum TAC447 TaxID=747523 RepID=A0ABY5LRG1_9CYAN|nr:MULTISPECIES: hypothetical protein [Nostocales]MBE9259724.1 hypothetical protein [Dolichospermum sp. LEGE 00246]UUO14527.1 hypothetical protein NG743_21220 [Dolichospermum heterosporum TAC447]
MANVTYDEIFGAVLTLPPLYRAMLAEHLLKSLDEKEQIQLATQLLQWVEVKINKEPQSMPNKGLRQPGLGLGSCIFTDDFDDPLPDEFWLGET